MSPPALDQALVNDQLVCRAECKDHGLGLLFAGIMRPSRGVRWVTTTHCSHELSAWKGKGYLKVVLCSMLQRPVP